MDHRALNSRLIALFILIVIVTAFSMATYYIVDYTDHDCTGDGCPICMQLNECNQILRVIKHLSLNESTLLLLLLILFFICSNNNYLHVSQYTLVRLKVRLNN